MYLVEEAVLQWFRQYSVPPGRLYADFGLGLEIVDSSVQLPALVEIDDELVAEVRVTGPAAFSVQLKACRQRLETVVNAKVAVALVSERNAGPVTGPPAEIADWVVAGVAFAGRTAPSHLPLESNPACIRWAWPIRYFHCHYSDRVQHSAYIRALEEVVDRFLAQRGLPIGETLHRRGWIPVVSRARVTMLADAYMDETVHTVFGVQEILKNLAYTAAMSCYVERGGEKIPTAAATILHGYATTGGPDPGRLAELDDATLAALAPERSA